MADKFTVEFDNAQVDAALERLADGVANPAPVLKAIGELLAESTLQRFATSTAPDGTTWEPNKAATLEAYLGRTGGNYKKDGSLSKKGAARLAGKKPLIGESRELSRSIRKQMVGDSVVEVGTNLVYGAMQQFGGTKAEFPHLWGDIPARPFLGISDADAAAIEREIEDYLAGLIG